MKRMRIKRRANMTLLEIMIVIFIIGIISSVIGYNMKGSLEKAKGFKTKEGIKKLGEIFDLEMAQGTDIEFIKGNPERVLKDSGLVTSVKDLLQDGWGESYKIDISKDGRNLKITSENYERFKNKMSKNKKEQIAQLEDDEELQDSE